MVIEVVLGKVVHAKVIRAGEDWTVALSGTAAFWELV